MKTLATVLVATVVTLAVGHRCSASSAPAATASRRPCGPLLDAAQTMPSFVYLLPGRRAVRRRPGSPRSSPRSSTRRRRSSGWSRTASATCRTTVIEAAIAAGSTPRQLLWKVQLPMARPALLLAANQGIVLVLAMVVVGGLVGAGALGFDVVAGFSQRSRTSARASPPASRSSCSASCSTGSPRAREGAREEPPREAEDADVEHRPIAADLDRERRRNEERTG